MTPTDLKAADDHLEQIIAAAAHDLSRHFSFETTAALHKAFPVDMGEAMRSPYEGENIGEVLLIHLEDPTHLQQCIASAFLRHYFYHRVHHALNYLADPTEEKEPA